MLMREAAKEYNWKLNNAGPFSFCSLLFPFRS